MHKKNSHCSYCGHAFLENEAWPRTCTSCGNMSFLNPTPVAVVLLPVDEGILVVRRNIEPQKGMLCLPGGFIDFGETWQEAGAREVLEETGISIDPQEIDLFCVRSIPHGIIIIVGLAKKRNSASLPPFEANEEATERLILSTAETLAFPLHTEVLAMYLAGSK